MTRRPRHARYVPNYRVPPIAVLGSIETVRLIDATSRGDWHAMSDLGQFIAYWGYPAIFVVVVLGNVGLPVPEETTLIVAGYMVWQGYFRLSIVLAVGVISAVAGDNIGYWMGRRYGPAAVAR